MDGWEVVSAVAACGATVAALFGLVFARRTVSEAGETVRLAQSQLNQDERARLRAQLIRLGVLVEQIHSSVNFRGPTFTGHEWEWDRNQIRGELIGIPKQFDLSDLEKISLARQMSEAADQIATARQQIENALNELLSEE